MRLTDVERLARRLMREHGAPAAARFEFDNAKKRAGAVHWTRTGGRNGTTVPLKLTLSRHLMALWDEAEVTDVILHEIAHLLAGHKAGHGPAWKAQARRIGARPERCYSDEAEQAPSPYVAVCPRAGHVSTRFRLPKPGRRSSCGKCSKRYDPTNELVWITRAAYEAQQRRDASAQDLPIAASTPTPDPSPVIVTEAAPAPTRRVGPSRQESLF